MVPIGSSRRWDDISWPYGNQWCHLQRFAFSAPPRRHTECLRSPRSWLQCPHSLGNLHVSSSPLAQFACTYSFYYRFTKEMKDESAGLLAAAFIGIVPGYISRSVAGSYDNEAIAIFLLMFTFFLWIKALKQGSALYGTLAAIFYFYMVAAWGKPP